jgi:hypothetical protein
MKKLIPIEFWNFEDWDFLAQNQQRRPINQAAISFDKINLQILK